MRTKDKVLIALGVLVAASALAMSGSSGAEPYLDVHDVLADEAHLGTTVSVKGAVAANTTVVDGDLVRFTLLDGSGAPGHENTSILVTYRGVLPDAFGPKPVVVTGTLVSAGGTLRLDAEDIQVGCSSKY